MKKTVMMMLSVFTCFNLASCSKHDIHGPDGAMISNEVILEWNNVAYQAFGGVAYQNSIMASRINAMTHLAMHDAVNAIHPKYSQYAYNGKDPHANLIAAAASAAHQVLVHEISERKTFLDSALQKTLATIPEGQAKTRGILLGKAAGDAMLEIRANDGSAGNPISPVAPSGAPGVYQPVPPFDFIFAPFWTNVKTFALQKNDQFRCLPPPAITSNQYSTSFIEVKEKGAKNSNSRTMDQTAYSNFWYEFSEAGWNRVARIISANRRLNLFETARLFALVDVAMADAYIAGWESKFYYNLWRPYTAIRNADQDANPHTIEDMQWEPALPTPPVQDYPSTHSALGNAAATVIAHIVGDQNIFSMSSPTAIPANSTRSFTSLKKAADENADSRVMAGIHFRFACEAGQNMGNHVGNWVVANYLKPLK